MRDRFSRSIVGILAAVVLSGPGATAIAGDAQPPNVEAMQLRLLTDDRFLDALYGLSGDATVRDVLDDPEIQRALQAGDTAALLQNPKVQRLATDPRIHGLSKELVK